MRLDLADLRLFIAIVDTGSITGGAANAHLALASASERLRKMEAEIGVPLLHRHARGVTMTEAGEVLARHARPLLAQQQRLRQAMHAFACGQRGTLRLFANTSAMSAFLPGKLAAWMAAHPAVQIETEERTSADIVSCILAGVAQAGVVSDAVDPGPLADVESEGLRKQLAIMRHSRLQFAERRLVRAFLRPIHPGGAMLAKQRVSDIAGDLYFALL